MTREQHLEVAKLLGLSALESETDRGMQFFSWVAAHHARAAQTCEACGGSRFVEGDFCIFATCRACDGTGWLPRATP